MPKEKLEFGTGSFVGHILQNPSFFDLDPRDQARVLGGVNGCPVVEELTDPENPNPGRGSEAMINRYGEVNLWFGIIVREAEEITPELAEDLMRSRPRRPDALPERYEPQSVPDNYTQVMAPMNNLAGHCLPRLMIEQIGSHQNLPEVEKQERLAKAMEILDDGLELAFTTNELLAFVAEAVATEGDVPPMEVLKQILGTGWYKEHKAVVMLANFKYAMKQLAPELSRLYESLSLEEKDQNKLV